MSIEYSVYGDAEKRLKDDFFNTTISSPTNDLIFTKPDAVKLVLDSIERNNPDAFNSITRTYCDIASKSGAFLIGIAERIFNSEEAKRLIPNPYKRVRHIYQYQIFALTSNLMCWWTIYQRIYRIYDRESKKEIIEPFCKQNVLNVERLNDVANFNEEEVLEMFRRQSNFSKEITVNDWDEIEVTDASSDRKFDYIISNPPYQVSKSGTKNVDVWHHFVEKATKVSDKVCMIHPGRWVVPKKNMAGVRTMLVDNGLYRFEYYSDSSKIFPGTVINGGMSITHFKEGVNDIAYSIDGGEYSSYDMSKMIFSNEFEKEVFDKMCIFDNIAKRIGGGFAGSGGDRFGYDRVKYCKEATDKKVCDTDIKVWTNTGLGRGSSNLYGWHYISRSLIDEHKYADATTSRKIMFSATGNPLTGGSGNIIANEIQIVEKNDTGANIFFAFPAIDSDYHLNLLKSYFETRTVRFIMSIVQKDVCVRGFENVPDYTYFIDELNGELFTDEFFYNKFNFSKELIDHIEKSISAK